MQLAVFRDKQNTRYLMTATIYIGNLLLAS